MAHENNCPRCGGPTLDLNKLVNITGTWIVTTCHNCGYMCFFAYFSPIICPLV